MLGASLADLVDPAGPGGSRRDLGGGRRGRAGDHRAGQSRPRPARSARVRAAGGHGACGPAALRARPQRGDQAWRPSCSAPKPAASPTGPCRPPPTYAKIRHQFGRPDRPVPGGQAPLRLDADLGRAGRRRGLGCGAHRAGHRMRMTVRPRRDRRAEPASSARVRGQRGRSAGRRCRRLLRARLHPGARRHRLHLGSPRPPVLPARDVAARAPGPVGQLGRTCRRAGPFRRAPAIQVELPGGDGPLRERLRGELAEIAALTGADRARALADGGWVDPASSPALGTRRRRARAGVIDAGDARGPGAGPRAS